MHGSSHYKSSKTIKRNNGRQLIWTNNDWKPTKFEVWHRPTMWETLKSPILRHFIILGENWI